MSSSPLFVGPRYVTPVTLAHMGLLSTAGRICGWGQYGSLWRPWNDAEIQGIHAAMRDSLQGPYPIYTLFESLFGTWRAQQAASDNQWLHPIIPDVN